LLGGDHGARCRFSTTDSALEIRDMISVWCSTIRSVTYSTVSHAPGCPQGPPCAFRPPGHPLATSHGRCGSNRKSCDRRSPRCSLSRPRNRGYASGRRRHSGSCLQPEQQTEVNRIAHGLHHAPSPVERCHPRSGLSSASSSWRRRLPPLVARPRRPPRPSSRRSSASASPFCCRSSTSPI